MVEFGIQPVAIDSIIPPTSPPIIGQSAGIHDMTESKFRCARRTRVDRSQGSNTRSRFSGWGKSLARFSVAAAIFPSARM